jgi:hypothetical protein
MLTTFGSSCSEESPPYHAEQELAECTFTIDHSQDVPTRLQLLALVGALMWLVDPKLWDDKKFRSLNPTGRLAWLCILTGPMRNALPGLIVGFSALTLADSMAFEVTECRCAIDDLLTRDMVQYDQDVRVLRIPNAPLYALCRNPNMLAGWFRLWNSVPDCALKFDHIGSLSTCVNFSNESMVERWDRTFGRVQHRLTSAAEPKLLPSIPMLDRVLGSHMVGPSSQQALATLDTPKSLKVTRKGRPPSQRGARGQQSGDRPLPTACFTPAKRRRDV